MSEMELTAKNVQLDAENVKETMSDNAQNVISDISYGEEIVFQDALKEHTKTSLLECVKIAQCLIVDIAEGEEPAEDVSQDTFLKTINVMPHHVQLELPSMLLDKPVFHVKLITVPNAHSETEKHVLYVKMDSGYITTEMLNVLAIV